MKQLVLPIKDTNVLKSVQDTLLHNFKYGRRNYTIFQTGKATLLRVSDVMRLKYRDVFDDYDEIRKTAYIHDKKTGKQNTLYLRPITRDLLIYQKWLLENHVHSEWLFPSMERSERHLTEKQFYKIMAKTGDLLNINYLGTHTMRKTGAYRVYVQSKYNIGLVMRLLNHSSQQMTLAYLGLDQESREAMLDQIDFG
ncbi:MULTISPECIES: site-specific integrase [Lactobacillaceae]|uniref:site-specific integrase n=1 Tax=Lactobacillaceae TaxID=33958 RepID=UPI0021E9446E|nr:MULTISPECIES: site-specific integrase [Lactobacillaceae]MCV3328322.1 site-specific integrase [Pediococcus ethanolidurans]MDA5388822.1 site-specific integrase [Loigolactobacillus backii]MDA5391327.1 site-specific integrase [Loigolactobacillus backii]MDT6953718.1 site-specific integrase [Companilactobacillus alimentarius]